MDETVRPIDANKLIASLPRVDIAQDIQISKVGAIADVICMIAEQPTVDPVKHGHWIYDGGYAYTCSVCGESMEWMPPYCCECGANMIPQIISTEESLEKDRYTKLKDCIKMIQDGENTIMAIASMLESIEHQDKEVSE